MLEVVQAGSAHRLWGLSACLQYDAAERKSSPSWPQSGREETAGVWQGESTGETWAGGAVGVFSHM